MKGILTMPGKVPKTHRGSAHKTEFLRNAVVDHPSAREASGHIATAILSFQQLYSELKIASQLDCESAAASSISKITPTVKRDNIVRVHFNEKVVLSAVQVLALKIFGK